MATGLTTCCTTPCRIAVATLNVLEEEAYAKYADVPAPQRVPPLLRAAAFTELMATLRHRCRSFLPDIFALQEFSAGDPVGGAVDAELQRHGYLPCREHQTTPPTSGGIDGGGQSALYYRVGVTLTPVGDAIRTLIEQDDGSYDLGYSVLTQRFRLADGRIVAAASCHLPFSRRVDVVRRVLCDAKEAVRAAAAPPGREGGGAVATIIAGDFNYTREHRGAAFDAAFPASAGWVEASAVAPFSAMTRVGTLRKVDHIYYSCDVAAGNARVVDAGVVPATEVEASARLVLHGLPPPTTSGRSARSDGDTLPFVSDHAAVFAVIDLLSL